MCARGLPSCRELLAKLQEDEVERMPSPLKRAVERPSAPRNLCMVDGPRDVRALPRPIALSPPHGKECMIQTFRHLFSKNKSD
jgi:hypothetical protein